MCGGAGDSCYNNESATTIGAATTPSGKSIEYVISSGSNYVWKEAGGNRVLRANGLDEWAKKLNLNGKGLSGTDFTAYTSIVGRKCPTNVYIDDSNKFTTGNCLYYTTESDTQSLNAAGTSQSTGGSIGLNNWSNYNGGGAKWYVGNIQTCATKGMRLPTVFETTTTDTTQTDYPTADGAPSFAGASNGIPSRAGGGYTWTASALSTYNNSYWIWLDASSLDMGYSAPFYVRCVLP